MKDDEPIQTPKEADHVLSEAVKHGKAAQQIMEREDSNRTPPDASTRRALEEHLNQAERLYTRFAEASFISAETRASIMAFRATIVKLRATLPTDGWKRAAAETQQNTATKGS
jgi:hypothetical protein